jgi:DNA-binding transcriptional LysR family regulator
MSVELRQLRCLVGIVETGTFTDAAIELGTSQAAVSRNLAALEAELGVRLLARTTRSLQLTAAGERTLRHAHRVLAALADLERDAGAGTRLLRVGYAWSALGRYTVEFQRRWAATHPSVELQLVRTNSSTAGLAEGRSDLAILRRAPDPTTYDFVLVGLEKRLCVMAADDALARKRTVSLAQVADRPIAVNARTGSTTLDLWPPDHQPTGLISTDDIEDWLTVIAGGRARGVTTEATAHQYRRAELVYRPVRDAPPVAVYLAWPRTDPPTERDAVIELLASLYAQAPAPS